MLADKGLADKQVRGIPKRFPRVLGNPMGLVQPVSESILKIDML